MAPFTKLIHDVTAQWAYIFFASILVGVIFAAQLVGFAWFDETLLNAGTTRSLHITLMLYGPVMLALSLLPFGLFAKDGLNLDVAVSPLKKYFLLWHLFLLMAVITIAMGTQRGLAFYDFAYELNFVLAASGIFYIIAIFKTIRQYTVQPTWVKVSKAILFIAPLSLIFLMNPQYGQVEATIIGPHGDNTLGMSFTLLPIFYLLVKLHTQVNDFKPRWHIFWIVPLAAYALSISLRVFRGELSYNEEWVFQWLTFAYAPLLWRWMKDAKITYAQAPYLVISIWSFIFVMVEGNILFIPEIRWPFHRNDLIVAHAHVAIGLGIFFMGLSALRYFYPLPKRFAHFWLWVIFLIFVPLSLAGFDEAGLFSVNIVAMWWIRLIAGILALAGLAYYMLLKLPAINYRPLNLYHLVGFASDGLGALLLFIAAPPLFALLGFAFEPHYYLVFGFMGFVGIIHLLGAFGNGALLAWLTATARLITGSVFISLYYAHQVDGLGVLVGLYDIAYALLYLLFKEHFPDQAPR